MQLQTRPLGFAFIIAGTIFCLGAVAAFISPAPLFSASEAAVALLFGTLSFGAGVGLRRSHTWARVALAVVLLLQSALFVYAVVVIVWFFFRTLPSLLELLGAAVLIVSCAAAAFFFARQGTVLLRAR